MSAVNIILILFFGAFGAWAHEGPPFPVVVDQPTTFGKLSIWADPDVGDGTFMIFFERERDFLPPSSVKILSENLEAEARRAPELDNRDQRIAYFASVPYPREGRFPVEVQLNQQAGGPILFEIDVTPPGPSRWQIWLFIFPFIGIGLLWTKAIIQRRRGLA